VNLVRSGRKQPQREHCVPGCGWWGCLHSAHHQSLSPEYQSKCQIKIGASIFYVRNSRFDPKPWRPGSCHKSGRHTEPGLMFYKAVTFV